MSDIGAKLRSVGNRREQILQSNILRLGPDLDHLQKNVKHIAPVRVQINRRNTVVQTNEITRIKTVENEDYMFLNKGKIDTSNNLYYVKELKGRKHTGKREENQRIASDCFWGIS